METTIVAPAPSENGTVAPAPELAPAFVKALDRVLYEAHKYASAADSPNVAALLTARDALVGEHPAIMAARAALDVEITQELGTKRNDALRLLGETYKDKLDALLSIFVPEAPIVARPSSKRGDIPVARTEADIDGNPEVTRIGAPLADIDAIGHSCPITDTLRKGANVKSSLAKVTNPIFENGGMTDHAACMALAGQVSKLFGHRYALKVKLGLIRRDQE